MAAEILEPTQPTEATEATEPTAERSTPRWRWKPRVWVQTLHRWLTFSLGILLLVVTTSGALALFRYELNRLSFPALYQVTPGAPVSLAVARAAAQAGVAADPALVGVHLADFVARPGDVYQVYLRDADDHSVGSAFVDPGTGRYLGHYNSEETVWGWLAKLHYSLFLDEVEWENPAWLPEWIGKLIGTNLSEPLLKITALLLLLMVLSGAYLWWPGIKKFAYGFRIRRGTSGFVWHYDWHKVVGFVCLPFLAMWAVTGLNFYDPFHEGIGWLWGHATGSGELAEAPEVSSVSQPGTMIPADYARHRALVTVPDAAFISVSYPQTITGTVDVWLAQGMDPYAYSEWPGQVLLRLDAYTGTVLDNSLSRTPDLATDIYNNWFGPIHFGMPVSWGWRLIWLLFGLAPLFLAVTGVMQWWLKWQKRRQRRAPTPALAGD